MLTLFWYEKSAYARRPSPHCIKTVDILQPEKRIINLWKNLNRSKSRYFKIVIFSVSFFLLRIVFRIWSRFWLCRRVMRELLCTAKWFVALKSLILLIITIIFNILSVIFKLLVEDGYFQHELLTQWSIYPEWLDPVLFTNIRSFVEFFFFYEQTNTILGQFYVCVPPIRLLCVYSITSKHDLRLAWKSKRLGHWTKTEFKFETIARLDFLR